MGHRGDRWVFTNIWVLVGTGMGIKKYAPCADALKMQRSVRLHPRLIGPNIMFHFPNWMDRSSLMAGPSLSIRAEQSRANKPARAPARQVGSKAGSSPPLRAGSSSPCVTTSVRPRRFHGSCDF